MGCCGSKPESDEYENAPLLGDDLPSDSRIQYPSYEAIDTKKEKEFLDNVLKGTTQNLIDISSSMADPLQEPDIQERVSRYQNLLERITHNEHGGGSHGDRGQSARAKSASGVPNLTHHASPEEVLAHATPYGPWKKSDMDAWQELLTEMSEAITQIKVKPVGDMVVSLQVADSSSTVRAH